jgi:hypothetical protein
VISMALGTTDDLKGIRDRALLLLGFAGAFRRSELVALDCKDIEESETGLKVTIRRSKTDQEGEGATIAIVRGSIACPVEAVKAWRDAAGITAGPLFRSIRKGGKVGERLTAQSVADIVKAHAENVGLDPAAFAPGGFPNICRQARRVHFQDDGSVPSQVGRYLARLCPGRGDFQGSCRRGVALVIGSTLHGRRTKNETSSIRARTVAVGRRS